MSTKNKQVRARQTTSRSKTCKNVVGANRKDDNASLFQLGVVNIIYLCPHGFEAISSQESEEEERNEQHVHDCKRAVLEAHLSQLPVPFTAIILNRVVGSPEEGEGLRKGEHRQQRGHQRKQIINAGEEVSPEPNEQDSELESRGTRIFAVCVAVNSRSEHVQSLHEHPSEFSVVPFVLPTLILVVYDAVIGNQSLYELHDSKPNLQGTKP